MPRRILSGHLFLKKMQQVKFKMSVRAVHGFPLSTTFLIGQNLIANYPKADSTSFFG